MAIEWWNGKELSMASSSSGRGGGVTLDLAETTSTAAPDGGQWLDVDDDHDALEREGLAVPMSAHEPIPGLLQHVHRLTRSFVHDGQRLSYIHVYARPLGPGPEPELEFITARESGFEGIACVDDVARAAILTLVVHEEPGSAVALRLARDWLRFVIYMQEPDGRFTNFIADDAGTKNRHGQTSYAGGRWWTARALWALATAWRVTGDADYLGHFLHGRLVPTRDLKVTALQALALMELYQCRPDDPCRPDDLLRRCICALCDA